MVEWCYVGRKVGKAVRLPLSIHTKFLEVSCARAVRGGPPWTQKNQCFLQEMHITTIYLFGVSLSSACNAGDFRKFRIWLDQSEIEPHI